jgi:hypothetical protein
LALVIAGSKEIWSCATLHHERAGGLDRPASKAQKKSVLLKLGEGLREPPAHAPVIPQIHAILQLSAFRQITAPLQPVLIWRRKVASVIARSVCHAHH